MNLVKLQQQQLAVKAGIAKAKKEAHLEFCKEYRGWVVLCDILIILSVLMNFGAVAITNAMVMKAEPDKVLLEANPITAERFELEEHPDPAPKLIPILVHLGFWVVIIMCFLYSRLSIYSKRSLVRHLFFSVFYFLILGFDFWNDAGFYIGKAIWGG